MEEHDAHVNKDGPCSKRRKRDFGISLAIVLVTVAAGGVGVLGGYLANDQDQLSNEGCTIPTVPLEEVMSDGLKFNLKGDGLDLTELAKSVEGKSLRSIREKLAGIIGDIFVYMKGIFQHIKKIFYVLSMCMMVYDGYK